MGIYRQLVVLNWHKPILAFLEANMLLLCIFLLSACFSDLMGSATEEFLVNFKDLVDLADKKSFLPVPAKKFQCNHVPCHLNRTMEQLKHYVNNDQMRTYFSLMENNKETIISALSKSHTKLKKDGNCVIKEVPLHNALQHYKRFLQRFHEHC